ncbi:MAG: hypothetical protein FJW78_03435 [Actinobacteria bacterium]|nr:hypothetical protein [Actinomycetota bacterium]
MALAMAASGLDRQDLSDLLGVTTAAVDVWRLGRGLPQVRRLVAVAEKLASALRTEPDTLLLWILGRLPDQPVPWGHTPLRVTMRDSAHEHMRDDDDDEVGVALSWIISDAGEVTLIRGADGRWLVEGAEVRP